MEFRPCIDIHNGVVKQIVGSSYNDAGSAEENYISDHDSAYFAGLYKEDGLSGGHVILLNKKDSPYYEATKQEAFKALATYPGGLQVGGGIDSGNAADFLDAGASHVIVTSYVFNDGKICYNRLEELKKEVGSGHIVLDLSCKKVNDTYFIATDRWQKLSDIALDEKLITELSDYCDEYLVHAVDVEGKVNGIEEDVVRLLASSKRPVTYAGGISSIDDLRKIFLLGEGRVNATIGSALSLFGGELDYKEVVRCIQSW